MREQASGPNWGQNQRPDQSMLDLTHMWKELDFITRYWKATRIFHTAPGRIKIGICFPHTRLLPAGQILSNKSHALLSHPHPQATHPWVQKCPSPHLKMKSPALSLSGDPLVILSGWRNCKYWSLSRVQLLGTPWSTAHQASLCSTFPRVCLNSCPLSQWCHPTISSSVTPFSSCLQSFPASRSFPMSGLFASGDQSIGASASASVLPMSIQRVDFL